MFTAYTCAVQDSVSRTCGGFPAGLSLWRLCRNSPSMAGTLHHFGFLYVPCDDEINVIQLFRYTL